MPSYIPVIIMLIGLVVGAVLLVRPVAQIIRLSRTPTTAIGLLPSSGEVEIAGYAEGATITSPIAGAPVVFWQVEVQELRSTGKSAHWKTVFKQVSTQPFRVTDGTGSVEVAPVEAQVIVANAVQESSHIFSQLSPDITSRLEQLGIQLRSFMGFRKRLRVFERHLVAGQDVFVLGSVEHIGADTVVRSKPGAPLIVADRTEQEILRSLYLRTAGLFVFVGAFVGFALWLMRF